MMRYLRGYYLAGLIAFLVLTVGGISAVMYFRDGTSPLSLSSEPQLSIGGDYFTADESAANEMSMDGGSPLASPEELQQSAAVTPEQESTDGTAAVVADQ